MGETKHIDRIRLWHSDFDDDSLEVQAAEISDLENDEIDLGEAGFLFGYEADECNSEEFEIGELWG